LLCERRKNSGVYLLEIEEKFNFVAWRKEQVGAARVFCFLVALAGQSVMQMFCPLVYDLITVLPFFLL
ncbi:hypothetical protein BRARA_B02640, partial [Brassica rapa]